MKNITVEELMARQEQFREWLWLDVRETFERISEGDPLAEALHIPLGELGQRYLELPRDRNIIVCCQSGKRAAAATWYLQRQGRLDKVYCLQGGVEALLSVPEQVEDSIWSEAYHEEF